MRFQVYTFEILGIEKSTFPIQICKSQNVFGVVKSRNLTFFWNTSFHLYKFCIFVYKDVTILYNLYVGSSLTRTDGSLIRMYVKMFILLSVYLCSNIYCYSVFLDCDLKNTSYSVFYIM